SADWSEPAWQMLLESGYFELSGKSRESFEPLRADFHRVPKNALRAPSILCRVFRPSCRGVEATFALAKAYQGSWLVHQLARMPGGPAPNTLPGQVVREVFLRAFEHPELDPDFRWALSYIDEQVGASLRMSVHFSRRWDSAGEAAAVPVRLVEG